VLISDTEGIYRRLEAHGDGPLIHAGDFTFNSKPPSIASEDGVWPLCSARAWLPRDIKVLRPVFDRMRVDGPDFLQRAEFAIEKERALTTKYRLRLAGLCDAARQKSPGKGEAKNVRASADDGNTPRK